MEYGVQSTVMGIETLRHEEEDDAPYLVKDHHGCLPRLTQ